MAEGAYKVSSKDREALSARPGDGEGRAEYSFTGSRSGMTPRQQRAFASLIRGAGRLVHGACIGADEQAHAITRAISPACIIETFPGLYPDFKADCLADITHEGQRAKVRDPQIMRSAPVLIAAPWSLEERKGGVWDNIQLASSQGIPVIILAP